MSNVNSDSSVPVEESAQREDATFADILSTFEQQHADGRHGETVTGTIVSVGPEAILVDIGRKVEGSLRLSKWRELDAGEPERGAAVSVSVGPRNEEGYY